jgi:hypothetical protein
VTPTGTLVASGLSSIACSTVAVSTDRGTSWRDDPLAGCAQLPVQNDRQWTAVDGGSTVYTVIGDTLRGHIDLVRAAISGGLALPSTIMELTTVGDYQWPGTIAVDRRSGTAYVGWNTTDDRIQVSVVGRGADKAPTPVTVARRAFDTYDSFVVVDVDRAGAVYVVWSERHPAQRQTWIMLARSIDHGRRWSTPTRVGRSSQTAIFPWITAGDAGHIAVSFYGTSARAASADVVPTTATWQVFSSYSTDAGRHFTDYRTTPGMHRGPICTSGLGCPGNTRNLLDFFETAADARGCLVTAYADDMLGGNAAVVSYVRQTSGPGLSTRSSCR